MQTWKTAATTKGVRNLLGHFLISRKFSSNIPQFFTNFESCMQVEELYFEYLLWFKEYIIYL